jgi:hypothetical protein
MGRFTLDSATEFLFGSSFHTLKAAVPYPHYITQIPTSASSNNESLSQAGTDFASAFYEAQEIISNRERLGDDVWPLFEILEDKTDKRMKVVGGYVEAIVEKALARRRKLVEEGQIELEDEKRGVVEDNETLLDYLVKMTEGELIYALTTFMP